MYRALYRKWRPQTFRDVVGQEAMTTALLNQINAGKVGHAYLFTGTRGTGKTTCAKIFAKAVNCEDPQDGNPCGECVPCKGLEDGSILDVIEIDAASNNGVDDIRDLRDETAYRPSRCKYKVYIVDEVHMLSTAAFNALLKIMEEPPSHVIFILATTEIHKVPATILSRCQRYDFVRIPAEKMAARLLYVAGEEGIALAPDAADLIARLADGALRDALSLLDTCAGVDNTVDEALVRRMAGVTDKGYLFQISDAVNASDIPALLELVAGLREKAIDVKRLSEELVHHYRNSMLASAKPDGSLLEALPAEERQKYAAMAQAVPARFAVKAVRRLAAAMDNMGRSPDPRIELELALFDLCAPGAGDSAAVTSAVQVVPRPATVNPAVTVMAQPVQAVQPVVAATPPPVSAVPQAHEEEPPFDVEDKPGKQEAVQNVPATPAATLEPAIAAQVQDGPPFDMPPEPPEPDVPEPPVQQTPAEEPVAVTQMDDSAQNAPAAAVETPVAEQAGAATPTSASEGMQPFAPWQQVIENMAAIDRMLYSYMKGSVAYLEGARILIDGGDMFLSYMREYREAGERIKTVLEQVTGRRYAIGPYTAKSTVVQKPRTAQETLQDWQQKGVPVEYE